MHVTIMTFVSISLSLRLFILLIATALFSNKDQHLSEHYTHAVLTSYTTQIEIAIAQPSSAYLVNNESGLCYNCIWKLVGFVYLT